MSQLSENKLCRMRGIDTDLNTITLHYLITHSSPWTAHPTKTQQRHAKSVDSVDKSAHIFQQNPVAFSVKWTIL